MAVKLIMTLDGAIIREYPLNKESLSIGRRHGNDIQLNDMTVSGRHALITTIQNDTFVEDLGSTNGTLVNGNFINKLLLMHGDIIQVGAHQFTYFSEENVEYEPTMFVKAELDETRMINTDREDQIDVKGMPLGAAKLLNGPCANVVMEMRKPVNSIGYKGKSLATISRKMDGYTLTCTQHAALSDKDAVPLLNGNPIGESSILLAEHDIIEIAGFQMQFMYLH